MKKTELTVKKLQMERWKEKLGTGESKTLMG
jgi:hypothetical protein